MFGNCKNQPKMALLAGDCPSTCWIAKIIKWLRLKIPQLLNIWLLRVINKIFWVNPVILEHFTELDQVSNLRVQGRTQEGKASST
jgi:hypothetical protein